MVNATHPGSSLASVSLQKHVRDQSTTDLKKDTVVVNNQASLGSERSNPPAGPPCENLRKGSRRGRDGCVAVEWGGEQPHQGM